MHFVKFLTIFVLLFFTKIQILNSAVVNSISKTSAMGFSLISPQTSGGTIRTSTSCATQSGTAKSVGTSATFPCSNGIFLVSGTNNSTGTNRNRITVIIPATTTISSGGNTMTVNLSLNANNLNTQRRVFNLSGTAGSSGTVSVPVYGRINVGANQATGDYGGSFTFMACNNSLTTC